MAVHAFPVRTMGSTCSTRYCNMGNNIKNGGPHFSSQNSGLYVLNQTETAIWGTISKMVVQSFPILLNQRLQYRGTISNMAVHAFSVRTMGSTCSTRYCNIGEQYQTWRSTLFQSEQWAPRAQPDTAIRGTISKIAVRAFQSEQWALCAQPDRDCNMGNNIRNGGPIFSSQNNRLHMLNQRLQNWEQYQTWQTKITCSFCRTMGSTCSTRDCITGTI
jgi:hypothetical protein